MVAWISAWSTAGPGVDEHATPGTTSQADSSVSATTWSLPTPHHEGGPELACVSFPPAVTTQIVRVLTQLTLPHTRLFTQHEQEVVPP